MKENKEKVSKLLILLVIVLSIAVVVLSAMLLWPEDNQDAPADPTLPPTGATSPATEPTLPATEPPDTNGGNEEIVEDPGVALVTKYIVLSYPSELEDMVSVRHEELEDGQQTIFTTSFTGEELELFRFSISKSGTDGYQLGVLADEEAGDLLVCMNVMEYSSGSWNPEEYNKIVGMQDRVNDIIIQFYADPRFTATRS